MSLLGSGAFENRLTLTPYTNVPLNIATEIITEDTGVEPNDQRH